MPINPYGMTKYVFERVLSDYGKAFDFKYVSLRYFNAAGADTEADIGEDHNPETHIIPLLLEAAYTRKIFNLFGIGYDTADGSCIRDYIHVEDLASAHIKACEYLRRGGVSECVNLGTGEAYSNLELIRVVEKVTNRAINVNICPAREGDPAQLTASSIKAARLFDWRPVNSSITNIVQTAWNWYKSKEGIHES
jgi:UDP-glucose 4-epimerase